MNKKIIKEALALVLITFVAVLLLAVAYEVTKEPIQAAKEQEKIDSYRAVLAGAETFESVDEAICSSWASPVEGTAILEANVAKNADGDELSAMGVTGIYKDQGGKGYVVSAANKGYGGEIVLSIGILPDGTISGVKVTSMSETVGLGAECQNEEWVSQFAGIQASEVRWTKSGKTAPDEIDAISSATKTTRAVTGAVNGALAFAREQFGYGGKGE